MLNKTVSTAGLAAYVFAGAAIALPSINHLEGSFGPAELTVEQVLAGEALALTLPGQQTHIVRGAAMTQAATMIGLAARSADRGVRLYAFVADGQLQSADVHGAFGHYRMMEFQGNPYWIPADRTYSSTSLPSPNPSLSSVATVPALRIARTESPNAEGLYEVRVLILHTPKFGERLGNPRSIEVEAQRLIFLTNSISRQTKCRCASWLAPSSRMATLTNHRTSTQTGTRWWGI